MSNLDQTKITPGLIISHGDFSHATMGWLLYDLPKLAEAVNTLTRYQWYNTNIFVSSINSHLYKFQVHEQKLDNSIQPIRKFTISFYDDTGSLSIGLIQFNGLLENTIPKDELRRIYDLFAAHAIGVIHCTDCGKEIKLGDQIRSVFAARYCESCWTGETGSLAGVGGHLKEQSVRGFYE